MTTTLHRPTPAEAVAKLETKASANHLALFFQAQQVRGEPRHGNKCVVARYLHEATGVSINATDQRIAYAAGIAYDACNGAPVIKWETVKLDEQGPVSQFIRAFDQERYPELTVKLTAA